MIKIKIHYIIFALMGNVSKLNINRPVTRFYLCNAFLCFL